MRKGKGFGTVHMPSAEYVEDNNEEYVAEDNNKALLNLINSIGLLEKT